jgi:flagellar basal-body rod modification protein FlgD
LKHFRGAHSRIDVTKAANEGGNMAAAAIFNHAMAAAQSLTSPNATPSSSSASAAADTSSTSSSDTSSATISANDFLTLLVTEMQNQDPTANTDPNEYINQLVNVNSLEQLIDINQNLSTALGGPGTSASSGVGAQTAQTASAVSGPAASPALSGGASSKANVPALPQSALASVSAANGEHALSSAASRASGNLSVPNASPAAHQVAHSLDGRTRPLSIGGTFTPTGSSL